jgi:sulfide:quinone oxidoreductase
LRGPGLPGLPADRDGFVPTDEHCRVEGVPAVYAVGDATTFPLKQGGLAAQQADAAVEAIAAELGLHEDPEPFRPILRGQLLTGGQPYYLRAELAAGEADVSQAARAPLWWPPAKVAGQFLAPYLAAKGHGGTAVSESRLVDQQPDPAQAPDVEEVAALAAALAAVDVSWVTPTSLRPPRSA